MPWTDRGSIQGPQGVDGGTTPHAARHAVGGDDPVSPASIGASATTHTHATGDVTSGTFVIGRIPTGTTSTTVSLGNHTHAYIPTSQKAAASGVASLDSTTRVPTAQMPRTPTTVRSVTAAATTTLDPTVDGNIVNISSGINITALGASTTGATDGQVLRVRVIASAAIAVTVASAVRTSTNITRGAYNVPSGQALIAAFEYVSGLSTGVWVLTAATISAT